MPKTITKLADLASERAVLAALCQYGLDAYLEVDFISSDDFTDSMNALIFECVFMQDDHASQEDNPEEEPNKALKQQPIDDTPNWFVLAEALMQWSPFDCKDMGEMKECVGCA